MRWTLLALAVLTTRAAAQGPDHCAIAQVPPPAAPFALDLPAPTMDRFSVAFQVAVTRLACGWEIAEDERILTTERIAAGCPDESEIAGYVRGVFDVDFSPLQRSLWDSFDTDAEVGAFCGALELCDTLEDGGFSAECLAAVAAGWN